MRDQHIKYGQKGAIVTIRLRNFMTYTDCTLKPAGNLNMIIGPNGSGKSAIVCAIIVGLAGEVSLTGRANHISSLVRKGCDWGSTWIELWSGKPSRKNHTIERKISIITRSDGKVEHKSDWLLNGKPSTMRDVRSLTQELNIKVDNLCQFLPQDSVASFVKMSHGELLINTLKAAGDNQLVEDIDKLIELTKDISDQTNDLRQLQKSSEENVVNARRLETEVERLRERETLAEQKKICSKKITYVKFTEACARVREIKELLNSKEHELKQVERSADPHKQAIESSMREELRLSNHITKCNEDKRRSLRQMQNCRESLENREMNCQDEYAKYRSKLDMETQRASKMQLKKQELEGYECRYTELRTINHESEIEKLRGLVNQHKEMMGSKHECIRRLESQRATQVGRIEALRKERDEILQIKRKKLNLIHSRRPDLYRMCDWLASHTEKFRDQVYLPMLCEINVIEATDAAVVEHAIPESDRWAFVCQCEHDLKYLTRVARQELNININIILIPERTAREFEQELDNAPQFPKNHFRAYMKDLIDAPEPILRFLYGQHNFHLLPVFTKETPEAELKGLMSILKRFYVRDKFYQISKSRYDGETMTVTDTVSNARDLIYSLDTKRLSDKSRALEAAIKERNAMEVDQKKNSEEYDQLQGEWAAMLKRLNEMVVKQGEKRRVETLLEMTRNAIKELMTTKIDMDAERKKLQQAVTEINRNMVRDLGQLGAATELYMTLIQKICMATLKRFLTKKNHKSARVKYDQAMSIAKVISQKIDQLKIRFGQLQKEGDVAKTIAEEKIPGFRNGKLDKPTQKKFALVPQESIEDLEFRIEELKTRIHGICRDPTNQILSDYNRQTEELKEKQKRISALEKSIETLEANREATKTQFIPGLHDIIAVINDHYKEFMRKLNYDGRVELELDESKPDDFSEYGIRILVKYRDEEELIALSSTRQSGGERSVATMIYMLALQTQTTVPFRVVDEINQGMDKDNERKVFELLVQTADESSSQYFLVSPKLLSGLHYGDKMHIHIVFNGPKLDFSFNDMMNKNSLEANNEESSSDYDST